MRKPACSFLMLILLAAMAGCGILESLTPMPAPTAPPTATPSSTRLLGLSPLELTVAVAAVAANLPDYNRRDWRHWRDEDGDCQNARQEVLIEESLIPVTFESEDRCRVASGQWTGPYTGTVVEDPGRLDIDHMVPLANAHRSGGWAWDKDRKAAFANDLGFDGHLVATTAAANRAKGSKGPEDWRPPDQGYWCDYAVNWTTVKSSWELTVTADELDALREMLAACTEAVLIKTAG